MTIQPWHRSILTTLAAVSALTFCAAIGCGRVSASGAISTVNVAPVELPSLAGVAKAAGFSLATGDATAAPSGQLVVWNAKNGNEDISPEIADKLEAYVRTGGSLWLTLGEQPGTGPVRLTFLLPTTTWETQIESQSRGPKDGPISASSLDAALFPGVAPESIHLSYHYRIRPIDGTERGQDKYERYARTVPFISTQTKAWDPFWTRPLINRDWVVRIWGDDVAKSPLLVTGRYGAGRVAILAGSITNLDSSPAAAKVETGVVAWLTQKDAQSAPPIQSNAFPQPVTTIDAAHRSVHVTLTNPFSSPLIVQAITRIETWEPALIGDKAQSVTLPANGQQSIDIALPPVDATSYQALDSRDAYLLRLGIISADGSQLLSETRLPVDLRPAVTVTVATDNLRTFTDPFDEPGQELIKPRMGIPVGAYAYAPKQTLNATVTVSNACRNIAPLAVPSDETQPDNASAAALNDLAAVTAKGPIDGVIAYGEWMGEAGVENVVKLTFPHPVTISSATIIGITEDDARNISHNPGAVSIEADGKQIASAADLDALLAAGYGSATFTFPAATATEVRVRLPWKPAMPSGKPRTAPWIGEVELNGWDGPLPAPVTGAVHLALRDALSGVVTQEGNAPVSVAPADCTTVHLSVGLPATTSADYLRLEATFGDATGEAPVLDIDQPHPLTPVSAIRPIDAPYMGFIVTRGFRNAFPIGTGTRESRSNWETNDDLVWAYSHNLKQTGSGERTRAGKLYVTDSDMRHYCTPWDTFDDGTSFFTAATPNFVKKLTGPQIKSTSDTVVLGFGDRWDSGPSTSTLWNWQDFVEFDQYLRKQCASGLSGHTRSELASEIGAKHAGEWQNWQLSRYIDNLRTLRDGFAAAGKKLQISAQGIPLVPIKDQDEVALPIRGVSDDSTWGMAEEDIPVTTGRQMAYLAFDPALRLSTQMFWGYNSAVLCMSFHIPVGTTEPSRRHYYDRAWRGVIDMDGSYRSMNAYGFNVNAGQAYTMTGNDWQQYWQLEQRHCLIAPEAPIGLGVVLSSSFLDDPKRTYFSGGGMGGSESDVTIMQIANVVRRLHEAGVSVPFSTNAATLKSWKGSAPLLLLNLSDFSPSEIAAVSALTSNGVHVAAFAGRGPLSAAAASLFGVTSEGTPSTGTVAGKVYGRPIVAQANSLLIPGTYDELTASDAAMLKPLLDTALQLPIRYPSGTAGYGFTMQGRSYVEVEDWLEQGRTIEIRLRARAGATTAAACEINDHASVPIRRDGGDWVISLPIRPGDGDVVCVQEN